MKGQRQGKLDSARLIQWGVVLCFVLEQPRREELDVLLRSEVLFDGADKTRADERRPCWFHRK